MKKFKFFKGQLSEPIVWRTAMGENKPLHTMTSEHIVNVMRVITDGYVPDPYLGRTNLEWMEIFEFELNFRIQRVNGTI